MARHPEGIFLPEGSPECYSVPRSCPLEGDPSGKKMPSEGNDAYGYIAGEGAEYGQERNLDTYASLHYHPKSHGPRRLAT